MTIAPGIWHPREELIDMTDTPDLEAFEASVRGEPAVKGLLDELTAGVQPGHPGAVPRTMAFGPADCWVFGLFALWQFVRVGIDYLRALSENAALQKRAEIINSLIERGADSKEAAAIVEGLLAQLRARPADDSVIAALKRLESTTSNDPSTG